jgi:hypothetical protein
MHEEITIIPYSHEHRPQQTGKGLEQQICRCGHPVTGSTRTMHGVLYAVAQVYLIITTRVTEGNPLSKQHLRAVSLCRTTVWQRISC